MVASPPLQAVVVNITVSYYINGMPYASQSVDTAVH